MSEPWVCFESKELRKDFLSKILSHLIKYSEYGKMRYWVDYQPKFHLSITIDFDLEGGDAKDMLSKINAAEDILFAIKQAEKPDE
jgi:hypothetical protein